MTLGVKKEKKMRTVGMIMLAAMVACGDKCEDDTSVTEASQQEEESTETSEEETEAEDTAESSEAGEQESEEGEGE